MLLLTGPNLSILQTKKMTLQRLSGLFKVIQRVESRGGPLYDAPPSVPPGLMSLGILSPPPSLILINPSFLIFQNVVFLFPLLLRSLRLRTTSKLHYFCFQVGCCLRPLPFESVLPLTSGILSPLYQVTVLHKHF